MAFRPEPLKFEAWDPAPQFRTLDSGPVSTGAPLALIGLDAPGKPQTTDVVDVCDGLFDAAPGGNVSVAVFTDHYCPNCRTMAATIAALDDIDVTLHELPILGRGSVVAARAALAAAEQGAREKFHRRMRRAAFSPTEAYLRDIATGLGLDPDRLVADLDASAVEARLRHDLALADALGLAAVPVTIVGGTVVVGSMGRRTMERLVEIEAAAEPPCP